MHRIRRTSGLTILALFLLWSNLADAQSNVSTGMVQGTVVDSESTPLEGAVVEANDPDTGFKRLVLTDTVGRYVLNLLPSGTFDIRAAHPDLQTEVKSGIVVTLGSHVRVDFQMQPAVFKDEVVVTAVAPAVEVSSSSVMASVSDTAIANLPLNGRNFSDLILLTPGAVSARSANQLTKEAYGSVDGVTIGAGSVQNSFNIDGASAQSSAFGGQRSGDYVPFTFSQAAIKEFQVIRSSYNLEYSAGGAVVNAITRSGSNQLHGEVFGYYRDENLVGADAEGNRADTFTQLQYGFALGGPVVRDRLHYFISYDEQDLEEPTFREFEGFPAGREQDWENLTGLDWNRETGLLMGLNDARVMLLKLDWQAGSHHLLTARYNTLSVPANQNLVNGWPISGWSSDGQVLNDSDSIVLSLNSVVSQRIVNEAFVQYATDQRPLLPTQQRFPRSVSEAAGTSAGMAASASGVTSRAIFPRAAGSSSTTSRTRWGNTRFGAVSTSISWPSRICISNTVEANTDSMLG